MSNIFKAFDGGHLDSALFGSQLPSHDKRGKSDGQTIISGRSGGSWLDTRPANDGEPSARAARIDARLRQIARRYSRG